MPNIERICVSRCGKTVAVAMKGREPATLSPAIAKELADALADCANDIETLPNKYKQFSKRVIHEALSRD